LGVQGTAIQRPRAAENCTLARSVEQRQAALTLPPAKTDGQPYPPVQQADERLIRSVNSRSLFFDFHSAASFSLPPKTKPAADWGFSGRLGEIGSELSLARLCSCARAPGLRRFPKGEAVGKGEAVSVCAHVVHDRMTAK
jgi:hypothetical protein